MNKVRLETLSACMMIKNEEKNLPRSLSSVINLVDEIVIVDTGSTDNSIEIAKSFGDKVKIFYHPWENDFSLHRNQTLDYATSNWCFIIDADEEVVIENGNNSLKEFLTVTAKGSDAAAVQLSDVQKGRVVMQFNTARFFRKGKARYEGIVHNQPILVDGGKGVFCPVIHLRHYGYDLSPEMELIKENRTMSLLQSRLEKNPEDWDAYFYTMQIHSTRGRCQEAVNCAEIYYNDKDKIKDFNVSIFFTVIHNYFKLENDEAALRWLQLGLSMLPDDLDLALSEAEYGLRVGDYFMIQNGTRRFIYMYDVYMKNPALKGNRFTYSHNPMALTFCIFNLGISQIKDSYQYLTQLSNILPQTPTDFRDAVLGDLKKVCGELGISVNISVGTTEDKGENMEGVYEV